MPSTGNAMDGSVTVRPAVTTIYTLTATGKNMQAATQTVMVTVTGTQGTPTIQSFEADPLSGVTEDNNRVTLTWTIVTNATSVSITADPGGAVPIPAGQLTGGAVVVTPTVVGMTTYTFTATGPGGTVTKAVMVEVTEADAAVIGSFTASPPDPAAYGADVTLEWTVTAPAGDGVSITASPADPGGDIEIPMGRESNGMVIVNPITTTTYTLRAISAGSNPRPVTRRLLVNVNAALKPVIGMFEATEADINDGGMTTLDWSGVTGADSVSIMAVPGGAITIPDAATMVASGSVEVMPSVTTVYTLTATGPGGMSTMEKTVTVNPSLSAVIDSFTGREPQATTAPR